MKKYYEYIRVDYDGVLNDICALASNGWEVCLYIPEYKHILLKRRLTDAEAQHSREFYARKG